MQQLKNIRQINKNNNVLIMSTEKYNNIIDDAAVNKLLKSEEDIENGRTREARAVIEEFRNKYGF